jgi:hypothetical protein
VSLHPNVAHGKRKGKRAVVVGVHKKMMLARVRFAQFAGTFCFVFLFLIQGKKVKLQKYTVQLVTGVGRKVFF